ncbi:DUF4376 domain-containing protein [Pandoraea sp. SD6-2]|uniref:DUF4376 domain-containing protein n=1 Tax=Pandoraea sp. SD6-2 TaxID=1286093 RepID=UPI000330DFE6|nr:DUF4376 domain-containing protein [Pandoraea sp. SD6-2]EON13166.1 hypothetical protein C266_14179 [Pandoraea sp. SD6-2]
MGYAINQSNGFRAVDAASDCNSGETYYAELPSPWPPAPTLSEARKSQSAVIDSAYAAAAQMDVSYTTTAGATKTYQADCSGSTGLDSQSVLLKAVTGYGVVGAVPSGFTWKSADNTLVSFTLDDLKGLYAAMLAQGSAAFTKRAALKEEIAAATTIEAVQAITWG